MSKSDVVVKFNNITRHVTALQAAAAELVAETANKIEADVQGEWGWTQLPIKTRDTSKGGNPSAVVSAGNNKRFYAAFLENGTIDQAPHPAMTPAAERAWPGFQSAARRIEKKLG